MRVVTRSGDTKGEVSAMFVLDLLLAVEARETELSSIVVRVRRGVVLRSIGEEKGVRERSACLWEVARVLSQVHGVRSAEEVRPGSALFAELDPVSIEP
jgi:hypothetical protein